MSLILPSLVPVAMTPEEHDHYDDVHDEEAADDDIAEVAGKIFL